jgi:hypothetical protein
VYIDSLRGFCLGTSHLYILYFNQINHPSHYLFFIYHHAPRAVRWKKEIQRIQIRMEEVKLSLLTNDIISYLKNPKNSTKKLLDFINTFSKVAR